MLQLEEEGVLLEGLLWAQKGHVKKLLLVLATSALMTHTSREASFERVPYIWYPIQFYRKNNEDKNKDVRALIDLGSKVNAMHPTYATKLSLRIGKIDVSTPKIDRFHLDTFEIILADCPVKDKLERVWFF